MTGTVPPSWPGWGGGVPYLGTCPPPPSRVPPHPDLAGGTLPGYPRQGTPQQGTPLAGPGRVPPPPGVCPMKFWLMLQSIMGYGYPPMCLPHGILGNVAKHYGIWVPPPPRCEQTENITFPILRMRVIIICQILRIKFAYKQVDFFCKIRSTCIVFACTAWFLSGKVSFVVICPNEEVDVFTHPSMDRSHLRTE